MATVQLKIPFDDRVISGLEVSQTVIAGLQAQGVDVQASAPEIDPATGKIIVVLNIPDTASEIGKTTAGGVSGVASPIVVPLPLFMLDLEGIALATVVLDQKTQPVSTAGGQVIVGMGDPGANWIAVWMGTLLGDGTVNTFYDYGINNNPTIHTHAKTRIVNLGPSVLSIPAGDLTLTFDGGKTQQVLNAAPLNVAASSAGQYSHLEIWVDENGLAYLRSEQKDGVLTTPLVSYDQAVKANPAGL